MDTIIIELVQIDKLFVRVDPNLLPGDFFDWDSFCQNYINLPILKLSPILVFEYLDRYYSFCNNNFIKRLYKKMAQNYPICFSKGFAPCVRIQRVDEDFMLKNYDLDFEDLMLQSVPLLEL
ncbi:hypothetical protein HC864_01310 [Candidatus Gracilibacteria bacterium]|nr:hypothetical protein [Thermales bacterium]NJL96443.1 hypothetical protein [Candidatus Gracilibacteria bacterium]